ncbi:MAG: hypothetical protein V1806_06005 [Pseudomonadota bacterium]
MSPWLALFTALAWALTAGPLWAGQGGHCRQCHLSDPSRVLGQLAWEGPLEQARLVPCPGRQAMLEELWATESLLHGLGARLPALARRGYYVPPWRQGLLAAQASLRQTLAQPLEDGQQTAARLAGLRRQVQEQVLAPMLARAQRGRERLWWGILGLGGLLLALSWLVGYRRGLPREPGEQAFAQVKAGRLP